MRKKKKRMRKEKNKGAKEKKPGVCLCPFAVS
jgi:hypothetical protein